MRPTRVLGRFRGSLVAKLLVGELAVILVGSLTLVATAVAIGPAVFRRHVRDALGVVPREVTAHLESAYAQSLVVSLAVAISCAAVAAALVGWLVASRVVGPIHDVAAAAARVARGEREVRVVATGSDEVATLATAFNDMAAALSKVESQRKRLLADTAHELRTPLAIIDAHLEGLADGIVEPSAGTWQLLRGEAARLSGLAEDIGMLSRAEEGRLELSGEPLRVQPLLDELGAVHRPLFAAAGVDLRVVVGAEPLVVAADPERVGTVIRNLLTNALRHTPRGGRVTLEAARDGDGVLLTVADTGEGIASEELEHVFERLYRVDPSRSRDRGGSGLGLAIARAVVEANGGELWAESDGPGRGARFHCKLPGR